MDLLLTNNHLHIDRANNHNLIFQAAAEFFMLHCVLISTCFLPDILQQDRILFTSLALLCNF